MQSMKKVDRENKSKIEFSAFKSVGIDTLQSVSIFPTFFYFPQNFVEIPKNYEQWNFSQI